MSPMEFIIFSFGAVCWLLGMYWGWAVGSSRRVSPKVASAVLAEESKRVRELLNGRKKHQVLGI